MKEKRNIEDLYKKLWNAIVNKKTKASAMIAEAVENGFPVDFVGGDGYTLLHIASSWDDSEACLALIDLGADITLQDPFGRTPISLACTFGCINCAKTLIQNGADLYSVDLHGWTALDKIKDPAQYAELQEYHRKWFSQFRGILVEEEEPAYVQEL